MNLAAYERGRIADPAFLRALSMQPDARAESVLHDWLTTHVTQPHSDLGRSGPICPFVKPALALDALTIRTVRWNDRYDSSSLESVVTLAVPLFEAIHRSSSEKRLVSLIVAFPGMPEPQWALIDSVHARVKGQIVARGLMIGQLHPNCLAPAAHNPLFPVNRSPMPLFVLRQMAIHDILFLSGDHDWFDHYQRRFGELFTQKKVRQTHLVAAYDEAARVRSNARTHPKQIVT